MNVEAKHIYLYLTHGETVKPFAQRQSYYGRNGGEGYIFSEYIGRSFPRIKAENFYGSYLPDAFCDIYVSQIIENYES